MPQLSPNAQRLLRRINQIRSRGNQPRINTYLTRNAEALRELLGVYISPDDDSRLILGYHKSAIRQGQLVELFYVTDVRENVA